ncbi:UNVERIFIED_CONTAM: hypothetical protein RMT77_010735 [Armadillidium vulgare]
MNSDYNLNGPMGIEEETLLQWVKPNDLMKSRKIRAKKQALKARFSCSPIQTKFVKQVKNEQLSSPSSCRNPFKCSNQKKQIDDYEKSEISNENLLFDQVSPPSKLNSSRNNENCFSSLPTDTKNGFKEVEDKVLSEEILPVDWSLKCKVRFTSFKPFQWRHTFKTSEEATGTTGFVRCLNAETEIKNGRTLDTSSNAQFYQCCLVWQHPNLPFINLFPREKQKSSGQFSIYASDKKISGALHSEWGESLRSLYQLLRVRQCPFFYICAHSFTCLLRAAGIAGFPHTHAFITPTSKGLRDAMKKEGIEFSMPLIEKGHVDLKESTLEDEELNLDSEANDESEEPDDFLETLGLETSQFPTLNQNRGKIEYKKVQSVDGSAQSLVYVEDMELQGLINFILNCGSCVLTTGPMAGIPPTLLSPVGFNGGTLRSLKVNSSTVRTTSGETQYCVDIQGPLLPTAVLHLCSLLSSSQDNYSVNLIPLNSSLPFCSVSPSLIGSSMPMAFASEGLVDCGIGKDFREVLCKSNDNSDEDFPSSYRRINFNNGKYLWSDKL